MLDPSLIYYRNSFSKAEQVVNIQKKNQHWPIQIDYKWSSKTSDFEEYGI